jgi:hypothetical protein
METTSMFVCEFSDVIAKRQSLEVITLVFFKKIPELFPGFLEDFAERGGPDTSARQKIPPPIETFPHPPSEDPENAHISLRTATFPLQRAGAHLRNYRTSILSHTIRTG